MKLVDQFGNSRTLEINRGPIQFDGGPTFLLDGYIPISSAELGMMVEEPSLIPSPIEIKTEEEVHDMKKENDNRTIIGTYPNLEEADKAIKKLIPDEPIDIKISKDVVDGEMCLTLSFNKKIKEVH